MNREFLMLCQTYDAAKHSPAGWYVSHKLDGQRAFWDGGVSRGLPAADVPYANTLKDGRYVDTQIATGLWSRYGKIIHAPDWFLDELPPFPLDGELYMGIGRFQDVMSTVKTLIPGTNWDGVRYMIFDMPPAITVFRDGRINNTNFKKQFAGFYHWYSERVKVFQPKKFDFESAYSYLKTVPMLHHVLVHLQERLPYNTTTAKERIEELLNQVTDAGGEGLILRKPSSHWTPVRSPDSLKVKKLHDMEGTVIGYSAGKETDKGSKLLGLMGSVRLRLNGGQIFDLSGFTDEERVMTLLAAGGSANEYLAAIAGQAVDPNLAHNPRFPIGSRITFRYRELTNDSIPKEARYYRKAD